MLFGEPGASAAWWCTSEADGSTCRSSVDMGASLVNAAVPNEWRAAARCQLQLRMTSRRKPFEGRTKLRGDVYEHRPEPVSQIAVNLFESLPNGAGLLFPSRSAIRGCPVTHRTCTSGRGVIFVNCHENSDAAASEVCTHRQRPSVVRTLMMRCREALGLAGVKFGVLCVRVTLGGAG